MKLGKFIKKFVDRNTLIRLYYDNEYGKRVVLLKNMSGVCMDWEITNDDGKYRHYYDMKVIFLKDIMVLDNYPEAVNIVIGPNSKAYYRNQRLKQVLKK